MGRVGRLILFIDEPVPCWAIIELSTITPRLKHYRYADTAQRRMYG